MKWINVDDDLPEDEEKVLGIQYKNNREFYYWVETYRMHQGEFLDGDDMPRDITHWMPMPKKPVKK